MKKVCFTKTFTYQNMHISFQSKRCRYSHFPSCNVVRTQYIFLKRKYFFVLTKDSDFIRKCRATKKLTYNCIF